MRVLEVEGTDYELKAGVWRGGGLSHLLNKVSAVYRQDLGPADGDPDDVVFARVSALTRGKIIENKPTSNSELVH